MECSAIVGYCLGISIIGPVKIAIILCIYGLRNNSVDFPARGQRFGLKSGIEYRVRSPRPILYRIPYWIISGQTLGESENSLGSKKTHL